MNLLLLTASMWLVWAAGWFAAGLFVKPTKSSEGALRRLQHIVPAVIGFYLIFRGDTKGLLVGPVYASRTAQVVGAAMTAAGLLFAVWARLYLGRNWSAVVTLKQGHELVRSGPYRFVRHPLYTGFLTAVLGSAVVAQTGDALVGFGVILVAYLVKMRREEAVLTQEFGNEYRQFKSEVAALVPYLF